jgi:hypothetical protein
MQHTSGWFKNDPVYLFPKQLTLAWFLFRSGLNPKFLRRIKKQNLLWRDDIKTFVIRAYSVSTQNVWKWLFSVVGGVLFYRQTKNNISSGPVIVDISVIIAEAGLMVSKPNNLTTGPRI